MCDTIIAELSSWETQPPPKMRNAQNICSIIPSMDWQKAKASAETVDVS